MAEFTGERLVPGLVDADLFNEHLARYRFAARFAHGADVLDLGCGVGYGTAEFTYAASVTAADISAEAVHLAARQFARPGVRFLQARCEALPFAPASFGVITAFEVIEHLERWDLLLAEALRVLRADGVFIVSTPNKMYYNESRGEAGPNPFHCHEFEYAEFESALRAVFPHVLLWTQNHAEAIVFAPTGSVSGASLEAGSDTNPAGANFFLAVCSSAPIAFSEAFAWVPRAANLLREREKHIAKLGEELSKKDTWLAQAVENRAVLQRMHEQTLDELKQRNRWAEGLNEELARSGATIAGLQKEADERAAWIDNLGADLARAHDEISRQQAKTHELESDLSARTDWARSIESDLAERTQHVRVLQVEVEEHKGHLNRQRELLEQNAAALARLREERAAIARSKWIRLGNRLNLGPVVDSAQGDR